jgi:myo-inositol-1(or 4)-monophosphatase
MNSDTLLRDFRPEMAVAVEVVRAALEQAKRAIGDTDITYKQGRDVVTAIDLAIEYGIRQRLGDAFGMTVVGEERHGEVDSDRPYWLLDPICGTRGFASGIPMYSTNLALAEHGEVVMGVVGDGSRDEIVIAERGKGAWALSNGALRQVTTSAESNVIVVEEPDPGDGSMAGARREHSARFIAAVIRADKWEFRSIGTTLGLAYVAAGRIAAYVPLYGGSLHAAAGTLIAAEAGCTVTEIDGSPWTVESQSLLVAATPELHAELVDMATRTKP